jgi:putative ABC transport system permease protein
MLRIGLKGLWAHKRRLAGTFLAVLLGASFLAGTLVLGDTLEANFEGLFADANAGTDVIVRSETVIEASARGPTDRVRGFVDASLADELRSVDGVAAAEPQVEGYGQLNGADGEPIGMPGPPKIAGNWIEDPDLNPYRLVEGRAPRADDEVVVNRGAAEAGDLDVGDTTTVETPEPVEVTIVGIATFGTADGLGPTTYTAFTLAGAERYVTRDTGVASSILVEAAPGVSQRGLVARIEPLLPRGVEAVSGASFTRENVQEIGADFLDLFRTFLLVFAGIALLVATFSINNTFSILVAQRTRESALLRAVGATSRQVLGSVAVEALLVGVLASAAGIVGGLGFAVLLKGLLASFGIPLPAGGLVFEPATAVATFLVGISVTLVAALAPAVRAGRVSPLAALRDVAVDRSGRSRLRTSAGVAAAALGVAAIAWSATGGGGLAIAGVGAVATTVGLVVLGPVVARPASMVIGGGAARLRGLTGRFARENAIRNPRRTAGTASALMIGVAVVSLFTVFISSVQASIDESVSRSFGGDLVVSAPSFDGGLSPDLAPGLEALPEVADAVGLGQGIARIDGRDQTVSVSDPAALGGVLDLEVALGELDGGLAISSDVAQERGWDVGHRVDVGFVDGETTTLRVGAIYDASDVAGGYVVPRDVWAPHAVQDTDQNVFVELAPGVSVADGRRAVERVASQLGGEVQDREAYVASIAGRLDTLLGLVTAMLALAIVIASMGIANTLSLSVHERTRELGLLRAVGGTRGQVRSMVRWESVIVALFGTLTGLALGVFLGWGLVRGVGGDTLGAFSVPAARLAVVFAVGWLVGLVAGIRPARRAARLDVMQALATE